MIATEMIIECPDKARSRFIVVSLDRASTGVRFNIRVNVWELWLLNGL